MPLTWQGRLIELVSEDGLTKHALNPYTQQWDILATGTTAVQAWLPTVIKLRETACQDGPAWGSIGT